MASARPTPAASALKRRTPWNTLSARVISLVSRKGGVGKTTSAVNLGAAFALSGHTVLIVGVDPQCGVARILGQGARDPQGGLLAIFERDQVLTDLARTSPLKELFFVSAQMDGLAQEERYLSCMQQQPDVFVQQIDRARNLYDTILIDCPPHLGSPTRAALLASDSVLVPVQAEELCRDSLGSLLEALETFNEARGGAPLEGPELEGIFLTMLSEHTRMGRHVADKVADEFGPVLLQSAVPRSTRLSEMALRGKPSVIYDRRSSGSRAYFNLADEILTRYQEREGLLVDAPAQRDAAADMLAPPVAKPPSLHLLAPAGFDGEERSGDLAGGLDRLLGDLRARGALELPSAPLADELADPEMVSLEDLLAEEEDSQGDPWRETWSADDSRRGRFN